MCSILGWLGNIDEDTLYRLLRSGSVRGRDGFGISTEMGDFRYVHFDDSTFREVAGALHSAKCGVANFRATPTTEAESHPDILQPYDGFVHNGTILNDKDFGNYEIDSMCLPDLFDNCPRLLPDFGKRLELIKGGFAIAKAYFPDRLYLGCNYKPIYYVKYEDLFMFASDPDILPITETPIQAYPYSCFFVRFDKQKGIHKSYSKAIPRSQNNRVLVSCSGGLDSVTTAYYLRSVGYDVTLVNFDYGCNAHKKEWEAVHTISLMDEEHFNVTTIKLPNVMSGTIIGGKSNDEEGGRLAAKYAFDWVSARNLLMCSVLTSYAESHDYGYIAFGGNLEESGSYPDNEAQFVRKFNELLPYSVMEGKKVELLAPLQNMMKHEIVKLGVSLGVPFKYTWSCYNNGEKHCGKCGPCYMRKKAFERNGLKDPVFNL